MSGRRLPSVPSFVERFKSVARLLEESLLVRLASRPGIGQIVLADFGSV